MSNLHLKWMVEQDIGTNINHRHLFQSYMMVRRHTTPHSPYQKREIQHLFEFQERDWHDTFLSSGIVIQHCH